MTSVPIFLVADDVRVEATGQITIVGMYLHVRRKSFEDQSGIVVFGTFTDLAAGDYDLDIDISHAESNQSTNAKDPAQVASKGEDDINAFLMQMPDFRFPSSGSYRFDLMIDGKQVASQYVNVEFLDEPKNVPGFHKDEAE